MGNVQYKRSYGRENVVRNGKHNAQKQYWKGKKHIKINKHTSSPYLGPHVVARFNKVLNFHLLELPAAEDKIAGSNFIPEGFANLGNSEGDLNKSKTDQNESNN